MKKNVLINCSNLHVGGGVAVATSFIDCLSVIDHGDLSISLLLSTEVMNNLNKLNTDLSDFSNIKVFDFQGLNSIWGRLDRYFIGMDLVFTVFGPAYFAASRTKHLFGFAQPNIIYPNNLYSSSLNSIKRLKVKSKFKLQELFFARSDYLVVELEHVKKNLKKKLLFKNKEVEVVSSSVHYIYQDTDSWSSFILPKSKASLKLGLISRNYPHKNLKILPNVKQILLQKYNLAVDFFVTFNDEEWNDCNNFFKESVINVGGLTLNQCPSFYESLDGVVFPSLLECFSAVPIEAMMSRKPLFASNLPFIRDVCMDYCEYFEPLDEYSIAESIYNYFSRSNLEKEEFIELAYKHVQSFPNANQRAISYLKLIRSILLK